MVPSFGVELMVDELLAAESSEHIEEDVVVVVVDDSIRSVLLVEQYYAQEEERKGCLGKLHCMLVVRVLFLKLRKNFRLKSTQIFK